MKLALDDWAIHSVLCKINDNVYGDEVPEHDPHFFPV